MIRIRIGHGGGRHRFAAGATFVLSGGATGERGSHLPGMGGVP